MPDQPFDTHYLHDFVARLRAGDSNAADGLLRACAGRLERLARKMLSNFPAVHRQVDTLEVFDTAAVRLLAALQQVRPASTREFFGLAGLQIRRELLTMAEALARRPAAELEDPAAVADPEDSDLEVWADFHRAVEGLPVAERETFSLVHYHGIKRAQAAELLGVHVGTVRRRYAAAVGRLQQDLGGHLP